jgi:translation initiation factor IF-1
MGNIKILKTSGLVIKSLPNLQFLVDIGEDKTIRCYLSGRMKLNKIKVILGDNVSLEYNPDIELNNQVGRIFLRK